MFARLFRRKGNRVADLKIARASACAVENLESRQLLSVAAPTNLYAYTHPLGYCEIRWQGQYSYSDIAHIEYSHDQVNWWQDHTTIAGYNYDGEYNAAPGQIWYFRVRVHNPQGEMSPYSNVAGWDGGVVHNPTATFSNDGPKNEGSTFNFNFTNQADAFATSYRYSFDFNNDGTFEVQNATDPTATYTFNDNGTKTVRGQIKDATGYYNNYTTTVTVNSVAPTAVFSNNGPIVMGNAATFRFTSQYDPSSADTTTGFTYSYDFNGDGTWEVANSPNSSYNYTFSTAKTYTAKGRITDKDGAYTDYTSTVIHTDTAGVIMTGYEPTYNPSAWNDNGFIQYYNNCYNYAANYVSYTYAQPGRYSGHQYTSITVPAVRTAAQWDSLVYLGDNPSDTLQIANWASQDYYVVALVVKSSTPNPDYHWYRHGSDGNWSHKPGQYPVTNLDASGSTIPNVKTANWGYYTEWGGYMAVHVGTVVS